MRPTTESKITQARKFWNQELYARERIMTNKIGEKIQNPRNTQEKTFWTHEIRTKAQWQDNTEPVRSMMAPNLRNLAQSFVLLFFIFLNRVLCMRSF